MRTSELAIASPGKAIAGFSQSLEKMLEWNCALWSEMARFTNHESLRFVHLQLDCANQALARLDDRHDLSGLLDAQQQWFKEMMEDYAAQSLRCVEMFQTLAGPLQQGVPGLVAESREMEQFPPADGLGDGLSHEDREAVEEVQATGENGLADEGLKAMEEIRKAMEEMQSASNGGMIDLEEESPEAGEESQGIEESRSGDEGHGVTEEIPGSGGGKGRRRRNKRPR